MSPEDLRELREALLARRSELLGEAERTAHGMGDEVESFPDPTDRGSHEGERSLLLRIRDRERKLLRKIEEALKRIEDGSYGFCEETGEDIGLGRLEARPTATLTVDAQERREKLQRQYRDDH